jgi:hypothetical protein
MEQLSSQELVNLIKSVFPPFPDDHQLGILVDIPLDTKADNPSWKKRRKIAQDWFNTLNKKARSLGFDHIKCIAYPDVGSNNAELPEYGFLIKERIPDYSESLEMSGEKVPFKKIFADFQIFLAPTEYSTTAPLKNAAKKFGLRAATMPGFSPSMIPALRIDYNEVFRRVVILKEKLDPAIRAEAVFLVDNTHNCKMIFDLRFRKAHLSSGRFPDPGTAGNVPSGETYIVPYEGELKEKSISSGILPVQIGEEVVFFRIENNRALSVEGEHRGEASSSLLEERNHLKREPAYGNMAELGFGVLADFGLKPINEILLDEKLGFHVAFGRSDHFGGDIGPEDFSSPEEVIHLDRVYIPEIQPRIQIKSLSLFYKNQKSETIMDEGKYLIF